MRRHCRVVMRGWLGHWRVEVRDWISHERIEVRDWFHHWRVDPAEQFGHWRAGVRSLQEFTSLQLVAKSRVTELCTRRGSNPHLLASKARPLALASIAGPPQIGSFGIVPWIRTELTPLLRHSALWLGALPIKLLVRVRPAHRCSGSRELRDITRTLARQQSSVVLLHGASPA